MPIGRFLAGAVAELFSLDSRLTATLKPLLLKPGFVAHEYNTGRRARFVPPVRLYLFASFVFFVVLAFSPGNTLVTSFDTGTAAADSVRSASPDPVTADPGRDSTMSEGGGPRLTIGGREVLKPDSADGSSSLTAVFFERLGRSFEDQDQLVATFVSRFGQVMFFLVPIFAVLLKLVYRDRLYVQHLVYALYFHVMVFSLIAVITLPSVLGFPRLTEWMGFLQLWIPVYFYLGLRRAYEQPRIRTLVKGGFVLGSYMVCLLVGMFVALVLAIVL